MKPTAPQILAGVVSLMVVAAVVAGFIVAGSPATERARRLDDQRVSALRQIADAVGVYVENRRAVPATLADLQTAASKGFGVYLPELTDPTTKVVYEYVATGPLTYRLCANFEATPRPNDPNIQVKLSIGGTPDFDKHVAGRQCWDIDLTERDAKVRTSTIPTKLLQPGAMDVNGAVVPTPVPPAPDLAQ